MYEAGCVPMHRIFTALYNFWSRRKIARKLKKNCAIFHEFLQEIDVTTTVYGQFSRPFYFRLFRPRCQWASLKVYLFTYLTL